MDIWIVEIANTQFQLFNSKILLQRKLSLAFPRDFGAADIKLYNKTRVVMRSSLNFEHLYFNSLRDEPKDIRTELQKCCLSEKTQLQWILNARFHKNGY